MDQRPLAPALIGRGTLSAYRDMLRALETLENVEYRFAAHGEVVDEGSATLVKLMADPDSATLVVNGCLFLNVASYRFMDFGRDAEGRWEFTLHGDASTLTLVHIPEATDAEAADRRPRLLSEEEVPDYESLILLEEEDEDD